MSVWQAGNCLVPDMESVCNNLSQFALNLLSWQGFKRMAAEQLEFGAKDVYTLWPNMCCLTSYSFSLAPNTSDCVFNWDRDTLQRETQEKCSRDLDWPTEPNDLELGVIVFLRIPPLCGLLKNFKKENHHFFLFWWTKRKTAQFVFVAFSNYYYYFVYLFNFFLYFFLLFYLFLGGAEKGVALVPRCRACCGLRVPRPVARPGGRPLLRHGVALHVPGPAMGRASGGCVVLCAREVRT